MSAADRARRPFRLQSRHRGVNPLLSRMGEAGQHRVVDRCRDEPQIDLACRNRRQTLRTCRGPQLQALPFPAGRTCEVPRRKGRLQALHPFEELALNQTARVIADPTPVYPDHYSTSP